MPATRQYSSALPLPTTSAASGAWTPIPRDAKAPTGWATNPSPVLAYSVEVPLPGL
ncbi:hypothetical protein [Corallococcus exercitus]|uniref:hypothetical protein n=1 Tax=Corallococcus exercitus TaxID=2316736 RepID=UPI0035D4E557